MIDRFRFWMIQNLLLMTSRDNERKFQFVKHVIQADSLKYYRIICYDIVWKNLLYARCIGLTLVIKLKKLCPMIHFTNESQSRIFMSTLDFADISFVFIKLKCWKLAATPTYRSMIQMYIWNWNIEIWRGQTVKRIFDGPVLGQTI